MLGRDEPWKYREASALQNEVVIAAPKLDSAHFDNAKPASFRAELAGGLFKRNDTMGDAMQLEVVRIRRPVVQHEDGAIAAGEELLKR
jgi:hypothetical protein